MGKRLFDDFRETVGQLMDDCIRLNAGTIDTVAPLIAASLASDGMLHTFGSGHSVMVAAEIVNRAGGLVPINLVRDPTNGWAETVAGYGSRLFDRYAKIHGARAGEFIIVVSNSGRNPAPIDVALRAQEAGLRVIALTAVDVSRSGASNHPSGKRLFEVADYVLDNRGLPGDAAVPLADSPLKVGPTSTFTGAILLNRLVLEVTDIMAAANDPLPILTSVNIEGGREANDQLYTRYHGRLSNSI